MWILVVQTIGNCKLNPKSPLFLGTKQKLNLESFGEDSGTSLFLVHLQSKLLDFLSVRIICVKRSNNGKPV